jgi:hypothetical protein
VIIFDQIITVNNDNSYQGSYNKLVLERVNNKWYIIDDIADLISNEKSSARVATNTTVLNAASTISPPSPAAARQESISNPNDVIKKLLTKWVSSWKSGDMTTYRTCYASDFKSKGMNLNDWISYKAELHKRNKKISVKIANIRITSTGNSANAIFTQIYNSPGLKSKGTKKLELKKVDGEWKIYKEYMS